MKAIFLIGEAKAVLDLWDGKTRKGKRSLAQFQKLNGLPVFEGKIIEKGNLKREFSFFFVLLENENLKKIPEITKKLKVTFDECAVIIVNTDGIPKDIGIGVENVSTRYHVVGHHGFCKLVIVLKNNIQIKDVNEIASVIFFNYDKEISNGRLKMV